MLVSICWLKKTILLWAVEEEVTHISHHVKGFVDVQQLARIDNHKVNTMATAVNVCSQWSVFSDEALYTTCMFVHHYTLIFHTCPPLASSVSCISLAMAKRYRSECWRQEFLVDVLGVANKFSQRVMTSLLRDVTVSTKMVKKSASLTYWKIDFWMMSLPITLAGSFCMCLAWQVYGGAQPVTSEISLQGWIMCCQNLYCCPKHCQDLLLHWDSLNVLSCNALATNSTAQPQPHSWQCGGSIHVFPYSAEHPLWLQASQCIASSIQVVLDWRSVNESQKNVCNIQ